MNPAYYISEPAGQSFYRITEIFFAVTSAAVTLICTFKSLPAISAPATRTYVIATASIISIYFLIQIWTTYGIGANEAFMWGEKTSDFQGWILLLLNSLTCWFIYKKDFQRISVSEVPEQLPLNASQVIDQIADTYKLTRREREIVGLIDI